MWLLKEYRTDLYWLLSNSACANGFYIDIETAFESYYTGCTFTPKVSEVASLPAIGIDERYFIVDNIVYRHNCTHWITDSLVLCILPDGCTYEQFTQLHPELIV